jgi:uncharacterized protein YrzB (UPF0473 family)
MAKKSLENGMEWTKIECDRILRQTGFFTENAIYSLSRIYTSKSAKNCEKSAVIEFITYPNFTFIGYIDAKNKTVTVTNTKNGKSGIARFNRETDNEFIPYFGIAIAFYRYVSGKNARIPKHLSDYLTANEICHTTLSQVRKGDIFITKDVAGNDVKYLCIETFENKMFVTSDMLYTVATSAYNETKFKDVMILRFDKDGTDLPVSIVGHDGRLDK